MKNTLLGIFAGLLFYGLMVGLTKVSSAQPDGVPATPPTAPVEAGKATGGVTAENGSVELRMAFNAHGGTEVKGNVVYTDDSGMDFKGKVDVCYNQSGDQAVFAGTVNKGNVTYDYFKVDVQDNGEGKKAVNPDMVKVTLTDTEPDCTMEAPTTEVVKGNLQVH